MTFGIHTVVSPDDPEETLDISHTGVIFYPTEDKTLPIQVLHFCNGSMVINVLEDPHDLCAGTFDDYLEEVLRNYRIGNPDEHLVAYWNGHMYTREVIPHP